MYGLLKLLTPCSKNELPQPEGPYRVGWLKPWELFQVAKLEKASFPEPLGFWDLLWLWLKPITTYLVIRDGNRVISYIGFQMFGPAAHTISMCIHPDYRRQGLGMMMQQYADRIAVSRGARWFTGEVRESNTAQLRMLERLGWENIGKCPRYFGNGEDGFVVWYWLCAEETSFP
jgi:ribosomal-protein-alanine N-acetyltransferase